MKKVIVWIVLSFVSVAAVVSLIFAPDIFGGLKQTISLDRAGALQKAKEVSELLQIGPKDSKEALIYSSDDQGQSFIELKGGSLEVLNDEIAKGTYFPSRWSVRHFNEGEILEAVFFFSPGGTFLGWYEKWPEKELFPNLTEKEAREKAVSTVKNAGVIDLDSLELSEVSSVTQIGGRIDWTFTWEKNPSPFGEGRVQWFVTVSGDRVTLVNQSLKVPESFQRWFENERSTNNLISTFSIIGILILTIISLIVAVRLSRTKLVSWKRTWILSLILGFGATVGQINGLSQAWINYDTAQQAWVFLLLQVAIWGFATVLMALFHGVTLAGSDAIFRRSFPSFISFGTPHVCAHADPKKLGKEVAISALIIPIFLLYVTLFYTLTKGLWGWWTPASSMIDPNIVGQVIPWLTPFGNALQAGIWEEIFFRALPLGLAVWAGKKWGKPKVWITITLVAQAILFAAGHAAYPGLPGYSRLVELIIPALMFGLLQLRWGLLPAILVHFGYDFVLMSQPIFFTNSSSLIPDRIIIILIVLAIPAAVIWFSYYKKKHPFAEIVEGELVAEIQQAELVAETQPPLEELPIVNTTVHALHKKSLSWPLVALLAAAGLVAWIFTISPPSDVLKIDRATAMGIAEKALVDHGFLMPSSWSLDVTTATDTGNDDRYINSISGREGAALFREKGYIAPPRWDIQWSDFTGDIQTRERWLVSVSEQNKPFRVIHYLPEGKSGRTLTAEESRSIAVQAAQKYFAFSPENLEQKSAQEIKQTARMDWEYEFTVKSDSTENIDARIFIEISGDEVTDAYRYIHIPEEWLRAEQAKTSVTGILIALASVLLIVFFGWACVHGFRAWIKKDFSVALFVGISVLFSLTFILTFFNNWSSTTQNFSLSQPLLSQAFQQGALVVLGFIIVSSLYGIIAGGLHSKKYQKRQLGTKELCTGVSAGLVLAGCSGLVSILFPEGRSFLPSAQNAASLFPVVSPLLSVPGMLALCVPAAFLWNKASDFTSRGKGVLAFILIFFVAGLSLGLGGDTLEKILFRILASGFISVGVWFMLKDTPQLIIIAIGTQTFLGMVLLIIQRPYPGSWLGALIGMIGTVLFSVWISKLSWQKTEE